MNTRLKNKCASRSARPRFGLLAALLIFAGAPLLLAQNPDQALLLNREYSIKAAFLYHFSSYVEWPPRAMPSETAPFVIGVLQSDPFGSSLSKIAQTKTVNGHPIEIRLLKTTEGIDRCQILFVPKSTTAELLAAVVAASQKSLVLVVGETDDFIERGGHVQFFLEENKVRFAFSGELTKRDDLKVSSKLLALAKIIPEK